MLCFLMIKSKRNHTQTTEATLMLTELNIDQGVEENCQDGDEILILVIDQERGYSTNNGGRPILMTPSSHSPTTPDKSDYYDKDWYDEYRELVVKKLLDVTAKKTMTIQLAKAQLILSPILIDQRTLVCILLLVCALECKTSFREL